MIQVGRSVNRLGSESTNGALRRRMQSGFLIELSSYIRLIFWPFLQKLKGQNHKTQGEFLEKLKQNRKKLKKFQKTQIFGNYISQY